MTYWALRFEACVELLKWTAAFSASWARSLPVGAWLTGYGSVESHVPASVEVTGYETRRSPGEQDVEPADASSQYCNAVPLHSSWFVPSPEKKCWSKLF